MPMIWISSYLTIKTSYSVQNASCMQVTFHQLYPPTLEILRLSCKLPAWQGTCKIHNYNGQTYMHIINWWTALMELKKKHISDSASKSQEQIKFFCLPLSLDKWWKTNDHSQMHWSQVRPRFDTMQGIEDTWNTKLNPFQGQRKRNSSRLYIVK